MQETPPETVGFRLSPQQAQPLVLEPGNAVQYAVEVPRECSADGLHAALGDAVARHEILRTRLMTLPALRGAQQVIADRLAPDWTVTEPPHAELDAVLAADAAAIDPERGPLLRGHLLAGDAPVLVLTAAAGIADLQSLLRLVDELLEDGAAQEPLQYADYAEWRHQMIGGEEAEDDQARAYWSEQLAAPPVPRPLLFGSTQCSDRGTVATLPVRLEPDAAALLGRAAASLTAAPAELLEAAWHALLLRIGALDESIVAGLLDGRSQPDLEHAVGPYAQRAPLHARVAPESTFAEILDQIRRARSEATVRQDHATGEQLAALSAAAGVGFAALAGTRTPLALRPPRERLALSLTLHLHGEGAEGILAYDPDALADADAAELARRYVLLLGAVLRDPHRPVATLPLLDDRERAALLEASAAPSPVPDASVPVHRLFERQAALAPARPAVASAAGSLTYGELDKAANQLAHHLQGLSAEGAPIGLCLSRTPALITGLLAIMKAGSPYLPLNPDHPPARVAHQLREAGARIVVSETALLEALADVEGHVVCVDRDAGTIAAHPEAVPEPRGLSELAYVMYTSGSTGVPKGVRVTHANLAAYSLGLVARLGIDQEQKLRFGLVSAISTDLGNTAIFPTLVSGGCVQIFSGEAASHAASLVDELGQERLDALKITPSHLRALLEDPEASRLLPRRWLLIGGEALTWELVARVRGLAPGCAVVNHYGPTETTVGCCAHKVEDAARGDAVTVPIGTPLPGAVALVLDSALEPLPNGVPGELCVGGLGVAAGYVGGRAEDAARFATGPGGGRVYRTGDRVRRLRDGALEFLGRLDEQVKIRGFRVEPGEVENVLRDHPAIAQAAVAAQDDTRGATELVAYLVPAVGEQAPSVQELRAVLARTLPDYMIPAAFATLPGLPLTPSGKVDRRALAGLAVAEAERGAEYVAPRDELEAEIAGIWQELLGVERVGVTDDFFALGGHSLLATQAIMRIRRSHGDVPLRALLAAPTVATLAEAVRAAHGERG